jgi:hypothetical protein
MLAFLLAWLSTAPHAESPFGSSKRKSKSVSDWTTQTQHRHPLVRTQSPRFCPPAHIVGSPKESCVPRKNQKRAAPFRFVFLQSSCIVCLCSDFCRWCLCCLAGPSLVAGRQALHDRPGLLIDSFVSVCWLSVQPPPKPHTHTRALERRASCCKQAAAEASSCVSVGVGVCASVDRPIDRSRDRSIDRSIRVLPISRWPIDVSVDGLFIIMLISIGANTHISTHAGRKEEGSWRKRAVGGRRARGVKRKEEDGTRLRRQQMIATMEGVR